MDGIIWKLIIINRKTRYNKLYFQQKFIFIFVKKLFKTLITKVLHTNFYSTRLYLEHLQHIFLFKTKLKKKQFCKDLTIIQLVIQLESIAKL